MFQPVAFSVHPDHITVVHQPVQCRRHHLCVSKQLRPVLKAFVGGEKDGALLMKSGHQVEEQASFLMVDGQITNLIYNDHRRTVDPV